MSIKETQRLKDIERSKKFREKNPDYQKKWDDNNRERRNEISRNWWRKNRMKGNPKQLLK